MVLPVQLVLWVFKGKQALKVLPVHQVVLVARVLLVLLVLRAVKEIPGLRATQVSAYQVHRAQRDSLALLVFKVKLGYRVPPVKWVVKASKV
jgi:hypothetical protein